MKIIKTGLTILLITFCLFIICAELASHYYIYRYHQSQTKANPFLQTMLLYQDVRHYMDKRNHDDLNSDNIRYQHEAADLEDKDVNVIFLGDSFIYGFLLSHRAAIPYQFEEIANRRLRNKQVNGINFGWVSASPYIELDLLKGLGKKYKPDVVILDLDLGDFYDDLRYEFIRERRSIYKLAGIMPFTTMVIDLYSKKLSAEDYEKWVGLPKSQLFVNERPIEQSIPYIQNHTIKNIDAIYDYTSKQLGAKFIVFVNPKTFHYNEKESPNNWLKDIIKRTPYSFEILGYMDTIAAQKPYPVISLLPAFQRTTVFPTAFDKDAHWNRDGYRIAATEMVEQCIQLNCFD